MPKVSVVILTFNRAVLLERAIQSVLAQTFHDFELIVVDDCSTDHTSQVVKEIPDERIHYIRHEKNTGEGGGRNTGLRNATGEYIGYLDDDDEWLPEKLKLQVECLDQSSPEVGAVHCGRMDIDVETGEVLGAIIHQGKGDIFSRLLQGNFLTLSSILLRAKCFEAVGEFDQDIPAGLDSDMWLRVSKKFQFECINQALVKYGIHKKTMSANFGLQLRGQEAWLRKYNHIIKEDLKTYGSRYMKLAMMYCLNGENQKGRKLILDVIKGNPMCFKAYALLGGSFLGAVGVRKILETWGKITGRKMSILDLT